MAHVPPFEKGPISDDPDELAVLHDETADFLRASDEQAATESAVRSQHENERKLFRGSMQYVLQNSGRPNRVDHIRADRDSIFADELLLSMDVELPAAIRKRRKK